MKHYVKASVRFHSPENGGRHAMPVGDGYAPYIRLKVLDGERAVRVFRVPDDAQFGQRITVALELSYHPKVDYSALVNGTVFELCEGRKVIAEGRIISEIYEDE